MTVAFVYVHCSRTKRNLTIRNTAEAIEKSPKYGINASNRYFTKQALTFEQIKGKINFGK